MKTYRTYRLCEDKNRDKKQVQEQAILGLGENTLHKQGYLWFCWWRRILSRKGETMTHQTNHTLLNESFDPRTILAVWNKAIIIPDTNPYEFRKDRCGALIKFDDYGNVNSDLGWEIDHVKPVVRGGTDDLDNLQPLNWRNNRGKADNWPNWTCSCT